MKITIAEAERKYFSGDWCMAVSFNDFLNILRSRGIEVIY